VLSKLLIATNNRGKIREIFPLLKNVVDNVICLADLPEKTEIEETAETFEGNAILKAEGLFKKTGIITLADDSGLEVDALYGRPGVHSARYAGKNAADTDNNNRLLEEMSRIPHDKRQCRFRCIMALAMPGQTRTFEGTVEGRLAEAPAGDYGFGYDPLFIPDGYSNTFGELGKDVKLTLSHRTRALEKVIAFLKESPELS